MKSNIRKIVVLSSKWVGTSCDILYNTLAKYITYYIHTHTYLYNTYIDRQDATWFNHITVNVDIRLACISINTTDQTGFLNAIYITVSCTAWRSSEVPNTHRKVRPLINTPVSHTHFMYSTKQDQLVQCLQSKVCIVENIKGCVQFLTLLIEMITFTGKTWQMKQRMSTLPLTDY